MQTLDELLAGYLLPGKPVAKMGLQDNNFFNWHNGTHSPLLLSNS